MNFDMILTFFIIGILPVSIYLRLYNKEYSRFRGFIFGCILLLFPILVFYHYQKTVNISFGFLDVLTLAFFTLSYNYLALTGRIGISRLLKSAIAILLFFFSSLVKWIPISLFSLDINHLNPVVSNLLTLFSDTFLLIILGFMYYDEIKNGIIKLKENFMKTFDTTFKYWLVGFIGMVVSNLLINLLFPQAVAGNENSVQNMISQTPIIMFFTAGIVAPIIEELVFRQAFKDILLSPKVFVVVSGVVFGLLHVVFSYTSWIDFLYVIPYSSLGIAFAYTVYKTDNITSSIMMHIIHNSAIIILSILTGMIVL